MKTEISKTRKITGWIISIILTALFLFSAFGKFTMPEMAENFTKWGLGDWRVIIAIGEIVSVLLFLLPKTNVFGTLLMSSYMGGAILIHMSVGEPFILQSVLLILIWVTAFVRNPELLAKFK